MRQAKHAGIFYPSDKEDLTDLINRFFENIKTKEIIKPIAGIVPHAGYIYSGQTASYIFKTLKEYKSEINSVAIIGPNHYISEQGLAVYPEGSWLAPNGEISVANKLTKEIKSLFSVKNDSFYFSFEHSIEVQIPFLIHIGIERIVPIIMLSQTEKDIIHLSEIVKYLLKNNTFILISSDLYHGYSYSECRSTDEATINAILNSNGKNFLDGFLSNKYMACGGGGIAAFLLSENKYKPYLLHYTNSGDVSGNRSDYIVGYSSIIFEGDKNANKK